MVEEALTEKDVERFVRDGAVLLKGAFSHEQAQECRDLLWTATGCDQHDPSTWSRPVGANANGEAIVDPASRERVLLLLFLFSDVGPDDAPTRLRLGSHHQAACLLFRIGRPLGFSCAARELIPLTDQLTEAAATGGAGDVWLCHPFLMHAAQRHRGTRVRFMAQPPLAGTEPIRPTRPAADRSPVEAVYRALPV